ncbi:MAG: hypothetical protein ACN4GZ_07105 [Acidimicrobiales bacterium]
MTQGSFRSWLAVAALLLVGCAGEEPQEIDLTETIPPTTSNPDDPNAAQRAEMRRLAEQQCIDDPSKDVGTVRIIDPETNEQVSELIVQCSEVRNP